MPIHETPRKSRTAVSSHGIGAVPHTTALRRLSVLRTEMHPGVYKLVILCWAVFLAVFWITFSISSNAMFMVAIGTVYAFVFFGVPTIMSRMAPKTGNHPSFEEFLRGRFDTFHGPIEAGEALLQAVLVPLALSMGGVIIGLIIRSARASF